MKTTRLLPIAAACLATLMSPQSGAVNLSTDNTGEVLLYPYYTVRNGFVTSFSIVNTNTFHTKAVKVRMREGRNGATVLDFHVWLPPRDVWTASIIDNGTAGAIYATDNSCTAPQVRNTPGTAQNFVNFFYAGQVLGTFNDNGGTGLDRTREGFIEVIEMGVAANGADAAASPATTTGTDVASAVKHNTSGMPANCSRVRVNDLLVNGTDLREPVGGLAGSYIMINTATGTEFAGNPVALQNFYNPPTSNALYTNPGSPLPDLGSVMPARSVVITASGTPGQADILEVTDWVAAGGQPIDAVSAVLMRSSMSGEYDVSPGFKTDMVFTMPTKHHYVQAASAAAAAMAPTAAIGPFTNTFASATSGGAGACDRLFSASYDRESAPYTPFPDGPVGVPPFCDNQNKLVEVCASATILSVVSADAAQTSSPLFGSNNTARLSEQPGVVCGASPIGQQPFTLPISGSSTGYRSGWVSFWPMATAAAPAAGNNPGQFVSGGGIGGVAVASLSLGGLRNAIAGGNRYRGLPVIGFTAIQALTGGQGYGGIFELKHAKNIAP